MQAIDEMALKMRLEGTIWEPGRIESFPGLKDASAVCGDLQSAFRSLPVDPCIWPTICHRLQVCQLKRLQIFVAWVRMRGQPWQTLGPIPMQGRDKSLLLAGLGGQRYSGSSTRGLDHVLPPGLSKEEHILQSGQLPNPFSPQDWMELDIAFVVDALTVWRLALPRVAQTSRDVLRSVAKALSPLEKELDRHRSKGSCQVAAAKRPGFVACLTSLLRWPDEAQAGQLVSGYPIVGEMADSGVFRTVIPEQPPDFQSWLGEAADAAMGELCLKPPPRFAAEILAITQEEQEKGYCSPFFTKAELDEQFGRGAWRAFSRFLLVQPDGKQRAIDDARRSGHNRMTTLHETIHTVHIDFIASVASMVDRAFPDHPDWLQCRIGTDDLPEAYRGLPVCEEHIRYSIVAIFVLDKGWRFSIMFGLAYGLESAVVAFNRFPSLGIGIARRCTYALAASYFDDELAVEFLEEADISQRGIQCVFSCMGATPQPSKSFPPAPNRHYLGASVHVGDFGHAGLVRFQPKTATVAKVCFRIDEALSDRSLDRDKAGKLRGDITWMFSLCAGQVGKLAGPLLSAKQHGLDPELSADDLHTLTLLRFVTQHAEPRDIQLRRDLQAPLIIYSDASFEHNELRLGWIIFRGELQPIGGTCLVPPEVLEAWVPRDQQIFPGEALCGLLIPWAHQDILAGHDAIWYVDNEAAVASLIKGSSQQPDVHAICQFSQVLIHTLGGRVWWEWINSESNPSDGLSRAGLSDPWSVNQGWSLTELQFPLQLLPHSFLSSFQSIIFSGNSG